MQNAHTTLPAISTIEFTNACNFTCRYCQRYDDDGERKVGMLSVELVEKMVLRGDFKGTVYTEFQQNGEPTLHPHFFKLTSLIRQAVPYIGMSTNGTWHKFKHSAQIQQAMALMDCITLSIHPETTQDDIEVMIDFIKWAEKPRLRIQTLNGNDYGLVIHDAYRDNYDIRKFGVYYPDTKACLDPQASVTIQWDGDVVACCNVVGKQRVYGNVGSLPLQVIWDEAPKTMFEYCRTCRTPSPYAKRLAFLADTLNA